MTIELDDLAAVQYIEFCKYYDKIAILLEAGVMTAKNCSVTLHMDNESTIKRIDSQAILFNSRVDLTVIK